MAAGDDGKVTNLRARRRLLHAEEVERAPKNGGGGHGGANDAIEVVDPKAPLEIARRITARDWTFAAAGCAWPTVVHWRGDFWIWRTGVGYSIFGEQEVRNHITLFLERCRKAGREEKQAPCHPNTRMVSNVLDMLKTVAALHPKIESPCWLMGEGLGAALLHSEQPPAAEAIAVANGIVHLPTGELWDATPAFFTTATLPIDFRIDDLPLAPTWEGFLSGLWPDDPESVSTLQEVFGYFLSGETRQHKIVFIKGPPRSGRGTIGRILRRLIGSENVCAPTFTQLGQNFGTEPLIGKSLAIIGDAQQEQMRDTAPVVEHLLSISGEDTQTVPRKNQSSWTGQLKVRFIIFSNNPPKLKDESGALASRLLILYQEPLRLTAPKGD